jgi:hypothetical protein
VDAEELDQFWSYVYDGDDANGCWIWTGKSMGGSKCFGYYGGFTVKGRMRYAHRLSYELHNGPVPDGHELDHLCQQHYCVNPDHLEPVTHQENIRRSERCQVTACPAGHPYDEINTHINKKGHRICRPCAKLRERAKLADATPEQREAKRIYARAHYLKIRKIAGPGRIQP